MAARRAQWHPRPMLPPPLHVQTPLVRCERTSHQLGRPVLLKMETHQPSGSFKLRGIGRLCQRHVDAGAHRLVGSSGGNAGYSAAWAARDLGVPITVVVPRSTPPWMGDKLRCLGADVRVMGEAWDEALAEALKLAEAPDCAYVHPFDHPWIWEGHASLVDEAAAEIDPPGSVVVAVGGGGLLCGVLEGLHRQAASGWKAVPVVAVETEGAASFAAARRAGRPVALPAITSVAKTLGALTIGAEALRWAARHPIDSVVLSDTQAVDACFRLLDDHRVLVEPSCGAALAAVYDPGVARGLPDGPVLVVVCGGVGVTLEALSAWREQSRRASR